MLTRILPTTLLSIFCKIILNSQVIVKNIRSIQFLEVPTKHEWVKMSYECDLHHLIALLYFVCTESISAVKGRAHIISAEFSKLFKKLEKERWKQVRSGVLRVACHIRSLLHECNSSIHNPPRDFLDQQEQLMTGCAKLVQYVENTGDTNGHAPKKQPLGQYLTYLGQSFSQLVDLALGQLVQGIITRMMESHSDYTLKSSINHLISLGLEGEHMCYIIARVSTIFL